MLRLSAFTFQRRQPICITEQALHNLQVHHVFRFLSCLIFWVNLAGTSLVKMCCWEETQAFLGHGSSLLPKTLVCIVTWITNFLNVTMTKNIFPDLLVQQKLIDRSSHHVTMNIMCQLGWAVVPSCSIKHYSRCCCEGILQM